MIIYNVMLNIHPPHYMAYSWGSYPMTCPLTLETKVNPILCNLASLHVSHIAHQIH